MPINTISNELTGSKAIIDYDECGADSDPIGDCFLETQVLMISVLGNEGTDHGLDSIQKIRKYAREHGMHVFHIRRYGHGGTAYKLVDIDQKARYLPGPENLGYPFNCPWDSNWYGFMLVGDNVPGKKYAASTVRRHLSNPKRRKEVFEFAEGQLELFSQWSNGEIFSYVIQDKDGVMQDSCGGFYGQEDCEQEARAALGLTSEAA